MCNKVCEIFEDSWQLMVEMGVSMENYANWSSLPTSKVDLEFFAC
jgi:hypothetical protein